jgi:tetratricopeptide (TPR) repeat protein
MVFFYFASMGLLNHCFRKIFVYALLLVTVSASSAPYYEFNERCKEAYQTIFQLKLKEGKRLLDELKREQPENLIPVYLENYIDFFELFFNEDPARYKVLRPNYEARLERLSAGPQSSPYNLFTRSVVHMQWAFVQVKFGKMWDGGWAFRRSFLQSNQNIKRFPSFTPSHLYNGALQVAAGTIPDGYKWLSSLLGIKGTVDGGMKKVETFLRDRNELSRLFHDEAVFYYLYLKNYILNDRQEVFAFIDREDLDLVNNHLFAYMAANLSINGQQHERALKVLSARNRSAEYFQTPVWDLEMGYALLGGLDDKAGMHFEKFIRDFRGRYYVKDALQKLSWHYYLQGNQSMANKYRAMILQKGSLDTEADKQAQKESQSGFWPDKTLLSARLLNDGGYNREALKLLHGKTIDNFSRIQDKLEFAYRAGRLYDDLGNKDQAIAFYKQAISLGEGRKEYYAARAALQIGFIYERKSDCANAVAWFRKTLSMKDHDYKNSLDQKSKAGLERCQAR